MIKKISRKSPKWPKSPKLPPLRWQIFCPQRIENAQKSGFWDHFLHFGIIFWGSDHIFFEKYLRKGSLFAILGSFFGPRSHFLGPKSADPSPRSNLSKLTQIAKIAVFTYEKGPFSPQITLFRPKMWSQRSKNDPKWQKMIPLLFSSLIFFFALFP